MAEQSGSHLELTQGEGEVEVVFSGCPSSTLNERLPSTCTGSPDPEEKSICLILLDFARFCGTFALFCQILLDFAKSVWPRNKDNLRKSLGQICTRF